MRNIARLLALILILLPDLALAQSAPANLPARTVYGRLGIPGDTGPGQAIPFTSLGSLLASSLNGGTAKMFPHQAQTSVATDAYTAVDPYGNAISCTNTQTQCLQEFLNVTTANGWPAEVTCQGTVFPSGAEPIYIQANTSVTVPVSQDWSFHSYGCNLNFTVTTLPGLIFDSQGASIFDWDGKIVYNVTAPNGNTTTNPSCVVLLKPTTSTADGFPGIYAGLIRVKSPVNNPLGGTKSTGVICIDTAAGSTIQGRLDFTEVNANNNAYYGVLAFGASASTGLMQTEININQIHGAFLHGVDVGFTSTNQANYNGNQWKINNIENADTASRGIDTYGSSDTFDIGVINAAQGGLGIGLVAESGALHNQFRYGAITGYTTNSWVDSGTCNRFSGGSGLTGGSNGTQDVFVGGTSGCTKLKAAAAASGTVTLPAATDTLTGKATTDVFTNKTYDTAGSGNVFKVNGTSITGVSGTGVTVPLTAGPTFTGTVLMSAATLSSTLTTNITGSTQCLHVNSSGAVSGTGSDCGSGGGSGITIGSTGITSGTTTKVLFDNAGVVGEYTISGSGNVAMTTNPVFTTPNLGTPSAATLTSATGLPISTGVSGLGTSVATALAVNVGSAGAFTTFNGAHGTPSSLTGTNITGTASGLTAGNVTTNANLTGDVTSVGNATTFTGKVSGALGQIPGTATNDNASTSNVGEFVSSGLLTATPGTATVTITIASPGVVTWTAHGITGITPVVFTTTGALPTGLTAGTTYWTISGTLTANTFQLATSIANAVAGTAIVTTGSQSGTHTGSNLIAATTNTPLNVAALSLTAGDWDVTGAINIDGAASTTVSYFTGSAGSTSATLNQAPGASFAQTYGGGTPFATLAWVTNTLPVARFSLSATTTIYLVNQIGFGVSTTSTNGFIRARRVR